MNHGIKCSFWRCDVFQMELGQLPAFIGVLVGNIESVLATDGANGLVPLTDEVR